MTQKIDWEKKHNSLLNMNQEMEEKYETLKKDFDDNLNKMLLLDSVLGHYKKCATKNTQYGEKNTTILERAAIIVADIKEISKLESEVRLHKEEKERIWYIVRTLINDATLTKEVDKVLELDGGMGRDSKFKI